MGNFRFTYVITVCKIVNGMGRREINFAKKISCMTRCSSVRICVREKNHFIFCFI